MIKEKDFVEIEYSGFTDNELFDTTNEQEAKDNDIYNEETQFGPAVICVGENQILKGIDKNLIGKESGKEFEMDLTADEAFGKKSTKLIKIVNTAMFTKQGISPQPGLQINMDNSLGTIKTVSGARTIVDFNHPLSGKDVHYKIKVNKLITDAKEKIISYLALSLGIKKETMDVTVTEAKAEISIQGLPTQDEFTNPLKEKLIDIIPELKDISFKSKE
jgi:FKBP-type peptidyl-prolyl cis-trans isomerase 2